jgi:uncharacterized tellurite resistance protein B-like protein
MSFSFSRLFTQKTATSDGFTQPQREALADLLHFCLYADNHIALAETQVVADAVGSLSWDPNISFEVFEARSIATARQAKEDASAGEEFLKSIRQRLDDAEARALALNLCKKLFVSDGTQSPSETLVLARVHKLLN